MLFRDTSNEANIYRNACNDKHGIQDIDPLLGGWGRGEAG